MPRARRPSVWAAKTAVCQASIQRRRQRTRPRPSGRFDKAFRMSAAVNSNPDFLPALPQHEGSTPNKQERDGGKIPHSTFQTAVYSLLVKMQSYNASRDVKKGRNACFFRHCTVPSTKKTKHAILRHARSVRVMMANPHAEIGTVFLADINRTVDGRETSTRDGGKE